ncbi:hypothetical protein MTP99_014073 [Tenebrio molitor]|nr:hypothetical protein MTP99_014073 [Tenebrio molitor]
MIIIRNVSHFKNTAIGFVKCACLHYRFQSRPDLCAEQHSCCNSRHFTTERIPNRPLFVWLTVNAPLHGGLRRRTSPLHPERLHNCAERGRQTSPSGFNKQTKVEIQVVKE